MIEALDLGRLPSWFVVLPDCDAASAVVRSLQDHTPVAVLHHASGRPWLVGRWAADAIATGRAGRTAVAVIGQHDLTDARLDAVASGIRATADLDGPARGLVGSAHLIASVDGRVRVQGSVTGVRRVFRARVGDVTVAADRADVLAHLSGGGLDEQRLALHLLEPHILYPLAGQPVWRGVDVVEGDHHLLLDERGAPRTVRWWTPPEPVVPMAEGAPALRDALAAAVAARVRGRDLVSCDLGGLDSTAVCCLAARGDAHLVAYTAASRDPLADDVHWAGRTVAGLGTVEHHVLPADEIPLVFAGLDTPEDRFDEPFTAATERDRWLVIARRAAARGSQVHLTGFGGDELLYGSVAHLHTLARTNPRVALGHLRGFAAKYRWPRRSVLRQLADTGPYRTWLAGVGDALTAPKPPLTEPLLDWGFQPRLAPWVTPGATASVRSQVRAAAPAAEPLAARRGQHRELETMRFVSRLTRQFAQMAARTGVAMAAPYYDDRVVEAGLAVRPEDRVTPWRYKPLITEAMRGIVPEAGLARQTKANGSSDEELGLRRHRDALLALWEDSRLARLGLVDAAALRATCAGPLPPHLQFGPLDQTVACELWLRSLERAPAPAPS